MKTILKYVIGHNEYELKHNFQGFQVAGMLCPPSPISTLDSTWTSEWNIQITKTKLCFVFQYSDMSFSY